MTPNDEYLELRKEFGQVDSLTVMQARNNVRRINALDKLTPRDKESYAYYMDILKHYNTGI